MASETKRFRDRVDAGRRLAAALASVPARDPLVLALPRGGVVVGFEVAQVLQAEFDVWVVRKIGAPANPELGVGAVAEGGYTHVDRHLAEFLGVGTVELDELIEAKRREVEARVLKFRQGRPPPRVHGRVVVVVDDGIATGSTVRAALRSIRIHEPSQLVLAVGVASRQTVRELAPEVDRLECLLTPTVLYSVGLWYEDFEQVTDDEVLRLLERANRAA
jgi:putative phosphoribosyl transferase